MAEITTRFDKIGNSRNESNILPVGIKKSNNIINQDYSLRNFGTDILKNIVNTGIEDAQNIVGNTMLGAYNGILHLGKQINDLSLRTHENEQKIFNETNSKFAQKLGISEVPTNNLQQRVIDNLKTRQDDINNVINRDNEKIQENIQETNNPITNKLAEIAPSIGQMLPGFIPGAGPVYFAGSASSQYTDEGLSRGMNTDKARTYGGVMGLMEGATETLGAWLTKGVGKALSKGNLPEALKTFGLNVAENFAEEAIIEPINEVTASLTGGKETADFSNLGNRMLESGINGALISIIMGGASAGVGSAINVTNKLNNNVKVTDIEIQQAVRDTQASGKVNVENIIQKSISAVKDNFVAPKTELPVVNERFKTKNREIANAETNREKAPIAENNLIRGINQRTNNNLELNIDTLPTARAKIENNRITLDRKTGRLEDIIHEATHYSESNNKGYETLKNHVLTELKKDENFEEIRNNINELYSQQYQSEGRTFTEQDLEKELVAKYTERFIGDESFVNKMTKADRNLAQKICDWIKDKVNYYKKIVKMEPEQIAEYDNLRKAEKLWEKALKGVKSNTSKNNQALRYSIAGKKGMENAIKYDSNNIDLERMYNRAKALQMNGVDNETIRKQTNWFQDKNGDWKFEFTDKQMSLKNNIKLKANTDYKLGDILQHNTLFMVYPELKNYEVKIIEMNVNGSFNAKSKTIKLNNSLLKNQKSIEGTLIHEIQHAIQHIEGFEGGRRANKSRLAYLNSLGEIEATDTKNRFYAEKYNYKNVNKIAPESSKINPEHQNLKSYLKNRGIIDKIKDSLYNYFETKNKNGDESYDYTQNKNDKGKIDNKNSQDVLQARRKDVGEIWDRWGSEEGRRISNQELDNSSSFSMEKIKERQLEIVLNNNPANDDYHTWIRNLEDIKTYQEALKEEFGEEIDGITPDFTKKDVENAIKTGEITVYSSYPIKNGIFVTPSKMEAESYAGNKNIYSKKVKLQDIAWIDTIQGQYAKIDDTKYSLGDKNQVIKDSNGNELSMQQQEYFRDSKVRDENGNLKILYHQTDNNFNVFDTSLRTHSQGDAQMPDGIFLKETQDNIGIGENTKQLELYVKITNPLKVKTRQDIHNYINSSEYDSLLKQIREVDKKYGEKVVEGENVIDSLYEKAWKEKRMSAIEEGINSKRYKEAEASMNKLLADWREEINNLGNKAREILTLELKEQGYDGVIVENDKGSFGRNVKSYIAFDSNQVKNVGNINPTDNPDIRYSLSNDEKKKYAKYKNDNTDYKNDMIDKALEIVRPNSQGRRTKEQWLNVADYIGKELDGLSEIEVEKIAYRSWFDLAPNQKEQLNRQGKNYVSFGVNEWVNKVTDSYKKTRTVNDNGTTYTLDKFYNENIDNFANIEEAEKIFGEFYNIQLSNKNESNVAEKAVRTKVVAMKANDTEAPKNIRQFYDNVMTSGAIEKDLKKLVNPKEYRKISNDETMNKAIIKLAEDNTEATKWLGRVTREDYKPSDIDVAEGLVLLAKYQSEKNYESAVDVIDNLAKMGTKGGRTVQMFALLQRLTPDGMLVYAQRSLQRAMELDSKNKSQEWIDKHKDEYQLTEEDNKFITERMEKVQNMQDGREKEILLGEIQKRITDKLPPEKGSSIKAYMRISMLFNPKTQIRNIMGNALIAPVNAVADTFGAVADKAVSKKTGIRTKGITDVKSVAKGTVTGIYKSFDDFRRGIDTRNLSGDRFELNTKSSMVGSGRANFNNKTRLGRTMNSLDRTLSFMLDLGDRPFYESAFVNSINNQMKLNNVNVPTAEMVEIATTEALQRTWQDNNGYTRAVLKIRDILNGNFRYGLGDVLIPFAKTPANLTKAIVDYSPAGFIKTLFKNSKELNNAISRNDKDIAKYQHKFVDNLGKGMAGSLLYMLGWALAKAGIATGDGDEDKDVANFMKNTLGIQPYSIKIGDKSFAYDWAQPIAIPVAIMSNYVKYSENNPEATAITKAIKASIIGSEQLFEQSFMSSISNVINGYNESYLENIFDEILALPARAVPTFLKQIADMVDSTQRTSFDKSDKLATAKNKVLAKLPIASTTLAPTVDTLGREVKKYGGDNNIFNVFFNPANTNKGQYTESAEEIYNLYKQTGDKTIFPIQAPYSVTIDGETKALDTKTRADYQKTTGQYSDNSIKSLLTSRDYKNLSDEEKVKILKNVIEDSNLTAKKEVLNYATDNETQKEKSKETGIYLPNMYIYNKIIKDMESKKDSSGETIKGSRQASMAEYITAMKTTEAQKNKLLSQMTESENKVTVSDLETVGMENYTQFLSISNATSKDKYKRLVSTGMNTQELNKYWNNINDIEGVKDENGKTISGSKKKAVQDYINSLNISSGEKLLLYASTGNYSLTYAEKMELFNYISSISRMTNNEKQELVDSLKCFQ